MEMYREDLKAIFIFRFYPNFVISAKFSAVKIIVVGALNFF